MKTQILSTNVNWRDIKNECRNTINKEATDVEPNQQFIKQILISEHSPIRLATIRWRWEGIKYWISTHWCRHWLGFDKWVSTQRTDRTGIDRDKSPQDAPVNMDVNANAQALINIARYRLCRQASSETRAYMEDVKLAIAGAGQPEIANVLVPNCIYRAGCPEFTCCGYWQKFLKYCEDNNFDISTIQKRYDAYNLYFYSISDKN